MIAAYHNHQGKYLPVAKVRTHCSRDKSHTWIELLLPPTTSVPECCSHEVTNPDPEVVSAISGSAVKEDARLMPYESEALLV